MSITHTQCKIAISALVLGMAAITPELATADTSLEKQTAMAEQKCQEVLASGSASDIMRFRMMYWMYDTTCSARAQSQPGPVTQGQSEDDSWDLLNSLSFTPY